MKPMRLVGLACIALLSMAGSSYGVYETPTSNEGCQIEPYAPVFGEMLDGLYDACDEQGYRITDLLEMGILDLTPEVTLAGFVAHLEHRDGIFGWGTGHGWVGLAVEAYEHTQSGWYASIDAYNDYLAEGFGPDEIDPDEHLSDGYHIAVKPALISRRYRSANSIAYLGACRGMEYASSFSGAREFLGYSGDVTSSLVQGEANTLWSRMNGEYGKTYRHVGGAQSGLTLARSGPGGGNTVLSPTVESYYPPEGTAIGEDSLAGRMVFDTRMDVSIDPSDLIDGNYNLVVKNESWSRGAKDTLKYILRSIRAGAGACIGYGQSEGEIQLDGNMWPYGTDGMGPNGDGYHVSYACTYNDPNIAARLASQWAYSEAANVVLGWAVEVELGTKEYIVEAGDGSDWASGWTVVGRVAQGDQATPGIYSISVASGFSYYRVVEIDQKDRRCVFHPLTAAEKAPEDVIHLVEASKSSGWPMALAAATERACGAAGTVMARSQDQTIPDWVFYGPDSLLAECAPAVAWFEPQGMDVDVVPATSPDY